MNNPLNAPQSQNELVLRLIGGERDGQLFTVQNEKCLLSGLLPKTEDAEQYRCAIFRGEKGVAFRSYSDHVLCNGAKVSVKWLKQGDLIKLTDSFSVEVIQLGVYSKTTPAAPAAPIGTRIPTQTVSLTPEEHPYENAIPARVAPVATQLLGGTNSPAEPRKFKPATNNLRTPSVTAPLETHQPLTPSLTPTSPSSPTVPAARTPANTQPINAAVVDAAATDSVVAQEIANEPANVDVAVDSVTAAPETMGSAIDSLTARLSKLVDDASGVEETPAVSMESGIAQANEVQEVQSTQTEAQSPAASIDLPNMPGIEVPSISVSPPAPVAEAVDSGSLTTPDPQPSSSDDSASRRSALESFFAKSGVSIGDASPVEDAAAPVSNPASPNASSVPVEAIVEAPPVAPAPSVVEAPPVAPALRQTEVTEDIGKKPEFDLDSVLAKLEASSANQTLDATPAAEVSNVANDVTSAVGGTGLADLFSSEAAPTAPPTSQPSSVSEAHAAPVYETPVSETPAYENTCQRIAFCANSRNASDQWFRNYHRADQRRRRQRSGSRRRRPRRAHRS